MTSLEPMLRQLSVRNKDSEIVRLNLNWAQREMLAVIDEQMQDNRPVRAIVLKARQLGISTLTEAIMFCRSFIYDHSHSLVLAHELDSSDSLFQMTKLFWETFPYRSMFHPKHASRRELAWEETGSSIKIASARNTRAGRGQTLNALHASEVGFWEYPEELMLGMRQTIPNRPGSMIVLESTANGVGNWFYDTWNAAMENEVEYAPLFFPWWKHYEYTASHTGLTRPAVFHKTEEERALEKMGASEDHLIWRRWAIRNLADGDLNYFMQEYPSTADEAFIASGANVFPHEQLVRCYEPEDPRRGFLMREGEKVRFVQDRSGPLRLFRNPSLDSDWGRYFIGADPAHSTMKDYACAQVINRRTYEQVATWHGHIDPFGFADELAKLGNFFNFAEIATEIEGPGYGTIGRLSALDYPHLWRTRWPDKSPGKISETIGWSTTQKRKEWAVGHLLKLVIDKDISLHDRRTYDEMRNFVTLDPVGFGPANEQSGHDDTVMAMAIACICSSTDGPLAAYGAMDRFTEAITALEDSQTEQDEPAWGAWG